jgi:hypothetical protein
MLEIFFIILQQLRKIVMKNIERREERRNGETEGSSQNCRAILWHLYFCGANVETNWGYFNIDVLETYTMDLAVVVIFPWYFCCRMALLLGL